MLGFGAGSWDEHEGVGCGSSGCGEDDILIIESS